MTSKLKNTTTDKSIDFGTLGAVTVTEFETEEIEVFAKFQTSPHGPTYSDDCSLTPPGGMQSPCTSPF